MQQAWSKIKQLREYAPWNIAQQFYLNKPLIFDNYLAKIWAQKSQDSNILEVCWETTILSIIPFKIFYWKEPKLFSRPLNMKQPMF